MKGDVMEAKGSMDLLDRAGRGNEARELIDKAATSAHQVYREIQADDTRTEDFKRDALRQSYEQVRANAEAQLAKLAREVRDQERGDAGRVFGVVGLSGDPASLAISRRDAADRVAGAQTRTDLRALLDRANRSSDEVLARAVAERATETGDVEILNAFLADRSHLEDAAQRLLDAAHYGESLSGGMRNVMALAALRPPGTF